MAFEWDDSKSAANLAKHGIDFAEATAVWDDPCAVERRSPYAAEPRFSLIGSCRGKLWFAVFTRRGATVRIISVRRARRDEEASYGGRI